ncbi:MAG: ABC transporter substrate-binding protein [Oscillospiraceae bacterium]|nr:ABC transporter substrate-binding protein [Oscillospiraceae bacterium]
MKKALALVLALVMLLALCACGNKNSGNDAGTTSQPAGSSTTQTEVNEKSDVYVNEAATGEATLQDVEGAVRGGLYVPSDETLVIAHKGNPTGLFPATTTATSFNGPLYLALYDRLTDYDYDTNEPTPMLATEWEWLDELHLQLKLRDDVYSHAGDHVTANDVIYTIEVAQSGNFVTTYFGMFDLNECKVVDDYTVILGTTTPQPLLLYNLSNNPMGMIVKASVERHDGDLDFQSLTPDCGTGPYKLKEWAQSSYITLERNEEYWNEPAYYKDVEVRLITDATARVLNLESGDVDIACDPDNAQLESLKGNDAVNIISAPTASGTVFIFNCAEGPFADVNVRRAVCLALNYEANMEIATEGYATLCDSYITSRNIMYTSPADGGYETYWHYDVEAAKEMMAKSSYPDGFKTTFVYIESAPFKAFGNLLQAQLAEIGIEVELVPQSQAVFYDTVTAGDFGMHILNSSNPDAVTWLRSSDPRWDFTKLRGGCNWVDAPQEYMDLCDAANATSDLAERKEIFVKLQAIIAEYCTTMTVYSPTKTCAADSDIRGIEMIYYGDVCWQKAYRVSD